MNRRDALSATALLFGGTIIGGHAFLAGCSTKKNDERNLSDDDVLLLDEIGETIIPETPESPGAKAAHIGSFIKTMVTDCYSDTDQKIFIDGLQRLSTECVKKYDKPFLKLSAAEQFDFINSLDQSVRRASHEANENQPHYFTMIKQLTLLGYFTSQPGATKALRYVAVPGRFDGCIAYDGKSAWAT